MKPIRWLFILIALVLLIGGIRVWNQTKQVRDSRQTAQGGTTEPVAQPAQVVVSLSDPAKGSADAAVTIVEFSDFECSYCAEVAPVLGQLVATSQNKVRVVWKDFPLPAHLNSQGAAEAARCAANQGKFWEYHDLLFQRQAELGVDLYPKLADELKLDSARFTQCLASRQTQNLVNQGKQEGLQAQVDGTPYLFLNGKVYTGGLSYAELSQVVQQTLVK